MKLYLVEAFSFYHNNSVYLTESINIGEDEDISRDYLFEPKNDLTNKRIMLFSEKEAEFIRHVLDTPQKERIMNDGELVLLNRKNLISILKSTYFSKINLQEIHVNLT